MNVNKLVKKNKPCVECVKENPNLVIEKNFLIYYHANIGIYTGLDNKVHLCRKHAKNLLRKLMTALLVED